LVPARSHEGELFAALRKVNLDAGGAGALRGDLLRKQVFKRGAVFEIDRNVDGARHVRLAEIKLPKECGEEFTGVKVWSASFLETRQFFPEESSAVKHSAVAHVEQVHGQHAVFAVVAEHVGVVAFDARDALLFLQLLHGRNQIAILSGALVLFGLRGQVHAALERLR